MFAPFVVILLRVSIPAQCPVCKAPASAFVEKTGNTYVTEHVVGYRQG